MCTWRDPIILKEREEEEDAGERIESKARLPSLLSIPFHPSFFLFPPGDCVHYTCRHMSPYEGLYRSEEDDEGVGWAYRLSASLAYELSSR